MDQLILTPEQTRLVLAAQAPIVVVSAEGATVGNLTLPCSATQHFSPAEITAIEARIGKDGPYLTTAETLASLSSQ